MTAQGMAKLVSGGEFDVSKRTVAATKLSSEDTVVSVVPVLDQKSIVLQTMEGFFLKFDLSEIPEKKKAVGVRAMKLGAKDAVEHVYYLSSGQDVSIEYKGKTISLNNIKSGKRDGKGTKVRI